MGKNLRLMLFFNAGFYNYCKFLIKNKNASKTDRQDQDLITFSIKEVQKQVFIRYFIISFSNIFGRNIIKYEI